MTRIVLCLLAGGLVASAQTKPNMTGVWELDKAKAPETRNAPKRMTFKITQDASTFSVATQTIAPNNVQESANSYTIGGASSGNMHGGRMTSDSAWDGQTLVIKSVVKLAQDLVLTDYWSLSPDGKTLTFREVSKFGTSPEADSTRQYNKQPDSSWDPEALNKPAEALFENISTLKGVPAKRVNAVMLNLTRWLGTDCWHCHVPFEYAKDDKTPKQTARKMFMMVRKINSENGFDGTPNSVSCWTCHRGAAKPQSMPAPAKPAN